MSSKRALRKKSCTSKKRYLSKDEAKQAAKDRTRITNNWIGWYSCKFCNGFHIGHVPRKVKQAIKARKRE